MNTAAAIPLRYPKAQVLVYARNLAIVVALLALAGNRCNVNWAEFAGGITKGLAVIQFFFPPDWSALPEMLEPALVTFVLALAGTPIGALLSFLLALGGSRNIAPNWMRPICRGIIAVERGLPEAITIVVLAAAFGMGALPGVLALGIGSVGMLGKLMADAMEEVDQHVVESVRSVGGTKWQAIRYAILPEASPALVTAIIFRFEVNIRASVVIGALGAGGLGYEISAAMHTFEYNRATVAIGTSLLLVFACERTSTYLR